MRSILKVLIVLTGLYCLAHIIFDLRFTPFINHITNVIQALFFLFLFIYVSIYFKEKS
jgi:hypothetical protein